MPAEPLLRPAPRSAASRLVLLLTPPPETQVSPWAVAGAFVARSACYAAMLWMALLAEGRAAPHLPDALLERIPYVASVDRWNYGIWAIAYVPVALALLVRDARRFCRYMVASGAIALLRGVCILLTGLGPTRGADLHAGLTPEARVSAFWGMVSPFGAHGGPPFFLTKDLFFSGHTATTLLLLLYVWRFPRLRAWMLVGHLLVVSTVFLAHLHYSIDVIGAYAITFSVFVLAEADLRGLLGTRPRPHALGE